MSSVLQEQIAGTSREGRRWVDAPALEAAWQETVEDHLGAALIEHGDSVIVKGEVLSLIMGAGQAGWNRVYNVPCIAAGSVWDYFYLIGKTL